MKVNNKLNFILIVCISVVIATAPNAIYAQTIPRANASNLPAGLTLNQTKTPAQWQGDFDHDGIADSLYAVKINPTTKIASSVKVLNLWQSASNSASKSALALLIKGSRGSTFYLLRYDPYFSSPIWQGAKLPVAVVKRGSSGYQQWRSQISTLKGDGIILGTEAGIDTLVYWDGSNYRLYTPNEVP
jgi:hypothetical protein